MSDTWVTTLHEAIAGQKGGVKYIGKSDFRGGHSHLIDMEGRTCTIVVLKALVHANQQGREHYTNSDPYSEVVVAARCIRKRHSLP